MLGKEDYEFLKGLQDELNSQPTCYTADPRFWVVMQKGYVECADDEDADAVGVDGEAYGESSFLELMWADYLYEHDVDCSVLADWLEEHGAYESDDGRLHLKEYGETSLNDLADEYQGTTFEDVCLLRERDEVAYDTLFLTLREAEEHIRLYGYRYRDPRPYCMCALDSPQFKRLIELLRTADLGFGYVDGGEADGR